MTASAVLTFKTALLDALIANAALTGIAIYWDIDEDQEPAESSSIGVLEDSFEQSLVGAAGTRGATRDEQLLVRLGVRYHDFASARASEEAVWLIVNHVQETIAADRSLGGLVHNATLTTGRRSGVQSEGGGWEQRVELAVTARARLRPI